MVLIRSPHTPHKTAQSKPSSHLAGPSWWGNDHAPIKLSPVQLPSPRFPRLTWQLPANTWAAPAQLPATFPGRSHPRRQKSQPRRRRKLHPGPLPRWGAWPEVSGNKKKVPLEPERLGPGTLPTTSLPPTPECPWVEGGVPSPTSLFPNNSRRGPRTK